MTHYVYNEITEWLNILIDEKISRMLRLWLIIGALLSWTDFTCQTLLLTRQPTVTVKNVLKRIQNCWVLGHPQYTLWSASHNFTLKTNQSECLKPYVSLSVFVGGHRSAHLRIPDSYDAKIAKICNLWTFWPVIQSINHLLFSELFGPVVNYDEKQNIQLQNFVLVEHPISGILKHLWMFFTVPI